MKNIFLKFKSISITIIIIFCFQSFLYQTVFSEENSKPPIVVDILGNGNFSEIQDAIDYAKTGDIIYVRNGTYHENIVIDKSINLIGENKTNTIIDGRIAGNVIKINSNNVEIQNFTIQNSGIYFPNSGINITSKNNFIKFNIIKNNLYGIILYDSSNNTIQNNTIKENNNCGIYLSNSSVNFISNNTIMNHNFNGVGIYDRSNNNILKNNLFFNNGYCGVNIKISSMNKIILNNISNNYIGIHIPSTENIIDNNYYSNNTVNIDKENLIPGFELVFLIISILVISLPLFKRKKIDY
jgi:parallel beta-helix repeat protein